MSVQFNRYRLVEQPTVEEWLRIREFRSRTTCAMDTLRRLGLKEISGHFARRQDGGYRGRLNVPPMIDLKALYVDFRHLYANDAPSNFRRVANIIGRRAGEGAVRRFMKYLRESARSSFTESGYFKVDGHRVTGDKLVDLWFNARIFHSDMEKREELARLEVNPPEFSGGRIS